MLTALLAISLIVIEKSCCWELSLVHVNDIHVRMEETNKYSAACRDEDKRRGKCFGGIARLKTAIKTLKSSDQNVLWLNAGDFYQGTVWYSHFKWRVVARFNNLLDFDAMTLGNHEFDDGVGGLVPFLRNQTAPCVVSNINTSATPEMEGLCQPSVVISVGSRRIGIVGYLTQETLEVSNPGKLVISDELEAVTKEAERLHNNGVKIILGLGHSGYDKDLEIAEKVPHIDAVIGGHTHSFLYSGERKNPSNNIIEGDYPTIVTKSNGKKAAVVQAYAYTKYLGHLKMTFDDAGDLISWRGLPWLMDSAVDQDEDTQRELRGWKDELIQIGKTLVGSTNVVLFKTREGESTIGNFVTDAMVWAYRASRDNRPRLAIINSGGIKAAFDKGNITMENLLTSFPFRNTYDVVLIKGRFLRQAFEHSVANMEPDGKNEAGRFLQVSGFKLVFDLTRPSGSRVTRILVRCGSQLGAGVCDEEDKVDTELEDEEVYSVIMTEYLAGGGDGFKVFSEHKERQLQGPLDTDILQEYLEAKSPVSLGVEDRINLVTINSDMSGLSSGARAAITTHLGLLLLLLQMYNSRIACTDAHRNTV